MALAQRDLDGKDFGIAVSAGMEQEFFTECEYFVWEENAFGRWEYLPVEASVAGSPDLGVIRAMSGGTSAHAEVAANIIGSLRAALRGSGNRICHVYTSDLKVHCPDGRNTYPDVSVVCGKPVYHEGRETIATNPIFLCEVLSPSTEADDRGAKWGSYRQIASLQHYLIVAANKNAVELYTRLDAENWRFQTYERLDAQIDLDALHIQISVADIYDIVDFSDVSQVSYSVAADDDLAGH